MAKIRKEMMGVLFVLLISSSCSSNQSILTTSPQPATTEPTVTSQVQSQATSLAEPSYPECTFRLDAQEIVSTQPRGTPSPTAVAPLPANQAVDTATTEGQISIFQQIWDEINTNYAYEDFNGKDWQAIGEKYKALVQKGFSQADFNTAMQRMVAELGDPMTFLMIPNAQASKASIPLSFVGIGGSGFQSGDTFVLAAVYPGSPAEKGGLKAHDVLLQVDGGPVFDETGNLRTMGEKGSPVTVTVQSPGGQPREITLTREQITTNPILSCRFSSPQIGYIRVLDWNDSRVFSQASQALLAMAKDAPLQGLILDNRQNYVVYQDNMRDLLSMFTKGKFGDFLTRDGEIDPSINTTIAPPLNLAGSQSIPLAVLTNPGDDFSVDMVAGILQNAQRAKLVGVPSSGIASGSKLYDIEGGIQLAIHNLIFQPGGLSVDAWGRHGKLEPDVLVSDGWLDYSEENDPYVAKALELLTTNP